MCIHFFLKKIPVLLSTYLDYNILLPIHFYTNIRQASNKFLLGSEQTFYTGRKPFHPNLSGKCILRAICSNRSLSRHSYSSLKIE